MDSKKFFSPAKINLFLAYTHERINGLHKLVSLVSPIDFGDTLTISQNKTLKQDKLFCTNPALPTDQSNLVLKASQLFKEKAKIDLSFEFHLDKKIPIEAGLGGGSSNATSTLIGLNQILNSPLNKKDLFEITAQLGSDCSLFLENQLVIIRDCGETVQQVSNETANKLINQKIVLIKPDFAVSTAWACHQLMNNPKYYVSPEDAEQRLQHFLKHLNKWPEHFFNNFQPLIFKHFKILNDLESKLLSDFERRLCLSGSGSACFIPVPDALDLSQLVKVIKTYLGKNIFIVESHLKFSIMSL